MKRSIIYFEKTGPENTDETISSAKDRAKELGIRDIVVASTHGGTGLKVADAFEGTDANIVVVTISQAFKKEGWVMSEEERRTLLKRGVKVFTGLHALGDDVNAAFTSKFGGKAYNEIVSQVLYRFCQGMKVAVEIVLMAADAGLIPVDERFWR